MPTSVEINVSPVMLGAADTIIGAVPVGKGWNIPRVSICNTSAAPAIITLGINGAGALTDTQTEEKDLTIPPKTSFFWGPIAVAAGQRLIGNAPLAPGVVACRPHGWEVTP